MVKSKKLLIGYKLFFGLLGFSAIVTEMAVIIERGMFDPINFFSFFTVENNILVSIVFLGSALAIASGKRSKILDVLRGFSTAFIVLVGIGFAVLLSGLEDVMLTAVPWDNIVLHYIIPVAAVVDYIIDRPGSMLQFKACLTWLLFPLLYVAYSMIRGSMSGWYPYPFLNPANEGYAAVATTVLGLLLLSIVLIGGVTRLSGRKTTV